MSKTILYSQGAVVEKICYMDEYMRAWMKARDTFADYWSGVRGWDANKLTEEQANEITSHPDWRKPCVDILPYGHLTEDDEQKLRMYSKGVKCAVELGTFLGRGAAILSEGAKKVITIDSYSDPLFGGVYHTRETVMKRLYNYPNISFLKGDTSNRGVVASIYDFNSVDFLFIDADHSYDGAKKDFEAWFPVLVPGAFILFHDSVDAERHPGVTGFVAEILLNETKRIITPERPHLDFGVEYIEAANKNNGSITVFRKR